jgi:hypothetical protein
VVRPIKVGREMKVSYRSSAIEASPAPRAAANAATSARSAVIGLKHAPTSTHMTPYPARRASKIEPIELHHNCRRA